MEVKSAALLGPARIEVALPSGIVIRMPVEVGTRRTRPANVLNRVPRKQHARVKRELVKVFHATGLEATKRAIGAFLKKFGDEFPTACETLAGTSRTV